jgi:rRNA maturation endonuclease Nob1
MTVCTRCSSIVPIGHTWCHFCGGSSAQFKDYRPTVRNPHAINEDDGPQLLLLLA